MRGTRNPKPASGVGDVLAAIHSDDARDSGVFDRRESLRGGRRELANEGGGLRSGHCDDRGPRATHDRLAVASPRDDPGCVGIAFDALDAKAGFHASHGARERVGERLHAVAKREAPRRVLCRLRAAPALAGALDLAADKAPVTLLERMQARECRRQRQALRIAGIHAGNERVDRVVEELGAEAATNERCDRFLGARRRASDERLRGEPQLRTQRERARREQRRGDSRQRHELSIADDEACGGDRRRFDALAARPRRVEQRIDERRGVECAVGSRLVECAVAMDRADRSPGACRGFEHFDRRAAPLRSQRGGEAGEAAADDDDVGVTRSARAHRARSPALVAVNADASTRAIAAESSRRSGERSGSRASSVRQ